MHRTLQPEGDHSEEQEPRPAERGLHLGPRPGTVHLYCAVSGLYCGGQAATRRRAEGKGGGRGRLGNGLRAGGRGGARRAGARRDISGQMVIEHEEDNLSDKEAYSKNIPAIGECSMRISIKSKL